MSLSSTISVPIPTQSFLELIDFLKKKGSDRDPVDVVRSAIDYWMMNADWKEDDLMPEISRKPRHIGYLWKSILLPPGTKIRMQYKGSTYHATVEGDDFMYSGQAMTPSEFANHVASNTARNAWRDLWIKRPEDKEFRLAEDMRRERMKLVGA